MTCPVSFIESEVKSLSPTDPALDGCRELVESLTEAILSLGGGYDSHPGFWMYLPFPFKMHFALASIDKGLLIYHESHLCEGSFGLTSPFSMDEFLIYIDFNRWTNLNESKA